MASFKGQSRAGQLEQTVYPSDPYTAVVHRLTSQFPEVPPETIQQAVRGEYDEYDNSAIRDFVPILVERAVRAELRHRA